MIRVSYLVRAALGLAVILGLLGWMTVNNERARSSGAEVILQTNPIDPRDVFFGHYATLSYRDFNASDYRLTWPIEAGLEAGDTVYFTLTRSGAFYRPGNSFATLEEAAAFGRPVLKAELFESYGVLDKQAEAFHARFDLPRQYFSDPETAMALQDEFQAVNESTAYGVILSVSDTGEAVIKGLYLDGQYVYDSLTGPRLVRERSE